MVVKFREAEKYLPQAEAAFRMVEQAIIDNHGEEEGRKLLRSWRAYHEDYLEKIADPERHKEIQDDPYDLPRPSGKCCASSYGMGWLTSVS